ncbi:MAG: c-type cytochrome [Myxococcota bacterium]
MAAPSATHRDPVRLYIAVFAFLTVVTVIECLPLFGIWDIPGGVLLALSALKFLAVVYVFMHLLGDHPVYRKLFFIPLVMAMAVVATLMTLFDTWTLAYRTTEGGTDSEEIAARYRGDWEGPCNAWAVSAATGNEYCASPAPAVTNAALAAAYEALKPSSGPDPRFEGFDGKSPEEKRAVLMAVGEEVYARNCGACHQAGGEGVAGTFPPMKGDPVANGSADEHVAIVLKGMSGQPIAGVTYAAAMPAWPQLTDEEVAAVVTFERLSWGNDGGMVEPAAVKKAR